MLYEILGFKIYEWIEEHGHKFHMWVAVSDSGQLRLAATEYRRMTERNSSDVREPSGSNVCWIVVLRI
jgi:hypothetical protein